MKLSAIFTTAVFGANIKDAQTEARAAALEISRGFRSDGNALLVQQMLQFYLSVVHEVGTAEAEQMLSYGCYCQLLSTRKIGLGEPVDAFDAICLKYQQCTKCVQNDEIGNLVEIGGISPVECNWENGRYEISFLVGRERIFCEQNSNDCGINLCKCDEELAWDLAEKRDLFKAKHSTPNGFEFADECVAGNDGSSNNGPGNSSSGKGTEKGELQCCGEYPARIPYHDQNGGRNCCVDKVFFTDDKKCCGNGNLVSIGGKC